MNPENQRILEARLEIIGRVQTPFVEQRGTPIQPSFAKDVKGRIIVEEPYIGALEDIEGFEHIWLLYWMDKAAPFRPRVVPYMDVQERGLFATRAPCRPNPIGISVVRLLGREGGILHVSDVDILNDTPLIDIKPYHPKFDAHPKSRAGWLDDNTEDRSVADSRFQAPLSRMREE